MLKRLKYLIAVFVIAVLIFQINRLIFLGYNHALTTNCSLGELGMAILHGFKLDFITAGYFTAFPLLATIVTIWLPVSERGVRIWHHIMVCYFAAMMAIVALIETADIGMFEEWQTRIDAQVMIYSPKEMLASVSLTNGIIGFLYFATTIASGVWMFHWATRRWFDPKFELKNTLFKSLKSKHIRPLSTLMMVLVAAVLFVVVRGGLTTATANISKAYFSSNLFLNQVAVNPFFSFFSTLIEGEDFNEYNFYDESEAEAIFHEAMHSVCYEDATSDMWLRHERPNVVIIITESLGRTVTDGFEGNTAVTPNINRLRGEGIWFENCYASSFRTDRGTVAILSGFPAQPKMSIMAHPNKIAKLTGIAQSMRNVGYETRFIYGGDANFTNTRAYLYNVGFNEVVDEREVNFGGHRSKWGSADDAVLNWASDAIISRMNSGNPTLDVILTLSSHEPFEVPYNGLNDKKLNAYAFTDREVGAFVERLRSSEHWDNTLVVIISDHGRPSESESCSSPERHHIPMLWVGGAVNEAMEITDYMSQTDLAATLLAQLGIDHSDFIFSRDISSPTTSRFGYWTFNNGFGIIDSCGVSIYDHTMRTVIQNDNNDTTRLRNGKAILQRTFMEINRM